MSMLLRKFVTSSLWIAPVAAIGLFLGCSDRSPQISAPADADIQRLRTENQEVAKLRRENQELPRLRKDNEEIQKLRSVPQELATLRKENDDLRQAAGKPRGQAGQTGQFDPATGNLLPGRSAVPGQPGSETQPTNAVVALGPDDPQEGDEIFVDPKMLGRILPGFDWEKLERKEPIAIKAVLDQQGIVLTNYKQLLAYGITNYVIQRNPPKPAEQPQ